MMEYEDKIASEIIQKDEIISLYSFLPAPSSFQLH